MATNKNPIFLNTVRNENQILQTSGQPVTVFTGGTDGSAVTNLSAATAGTNDNEVVLRIVSGGVTIQLGRIPIPSGAGFGSGPAVNLLDPDFIPGALQEDGSLLLGANATLRADAGSTLTAEISIFSAGGDYAG